MNGLEDLHPANRGITIIPEKPNQIVERATRRGKTSRHPAGLGLGVEGKYSTLTNLIMVDLGIRIPNKALVGLSQFTELLPVEPLLPWWH